MVAISKRKDTGLLHSMWQFPNIENQLEISQVEKYLTKNNICFSKIEKAISYVHVFTHKKWNMCSYLITLNEKIEFNSIIWVSLKELDNFYAIPTAFQPFKKFLEEKIK